MHPGLFGGETRTNETILETCVQMAG